MDRGARDGQNTRATALSLGLRHVAVSLETSRYGLQLKYRGLGWFSLPSVWFFQIILVAITPLVDLFLLVSLPFGAWRALLPFVIIFLAMDVILATLACILERDPILRA